MHESSHGGGFQVWRRVAVVGILLGVCGIFLHFRSMGRGVHRGVPLVDFPLDFQGWIGRPIRISGDVLAVLGPGEFLERTYRGSGTGVPVNLFVAYFPNQRRGDTMHSPQDCLPGSGWTPISSRRLTVVGWQGKSLTVNRYVIAKGLDRMLVLYWYEEQGRDVANEYVAKAYLITDSIAENRTDGALVRVSVPIVSHGNAGKAQQTALAFTRDALPVLRTYIEK